jgi:hypothetical protein
MKIILSKICNNNNNNNNDNNNKNNNNNNNTCFCISMEFSYGVPISLRGPAEFRGTPFKKH